MTRKAFLEGLRGGPPPAPRPINLANPGNAHLTACTCTHAPDEHDHLAGCIALVEPLDGGREEFCLCTKYQVAP